MNRELNCERVEPDLTGYLLGALPTAREADLRTHLEICERCRASAKELADTLDLLRGALAASPSVPTALSPERRAKVLGAKRPRVVEAWHTWLYPVARAALLVLVPGILLAALLLPALQSARERVSIIGSLSAEPAADASRYYSTVRAPAATAATPARELRAETGWADSDGRRGDARWAMKPESAAAPAEAPPATTPPAKFAGQVADEAVSLGDAVRVTTASGSSMDVDFIAPPAAPAAAPTPVVEALGRFKSSVHELPSGGRLPALSAATAAPADPFATADGSVRNAVASDPFGNGPGAVAGGYAMGGGGGAGNWEEGRKRTTAPAGAVSEVRKLGENGRAESGLEKSLSFDSLAVAKKESAKEIYVPLRPSLPKPMFVGTPVPAKAPNLEPPGTRQTFDVPAAVAEGRAVVMSESAPATPPAAPAPVMQPPPAAASRSARSGQGELSRVSGGSVATGAKANEQASFAYHRAGGDRAGDAGVLKDLNGPSAGEADRKPAQPIGNRSGGNGVATGKDAQKIANGELRYDDEAKPSSAAGLVALDYEMTAADGKSRSDATRKTDTDGEKGQTTESLAKSKEQPVVMKGLFMGRATSGRAGALTKAGAGTLDLSGVNTFNGGTIVSGGSLTVANARPAPDAAAAIPSPEQPVSGLADKRDALSAMGDQDSDARAEERKKLPALGEVPALGRLYKEGETLREKAPADDMKRLSEPATAPKFTAAGFNPVVNAKENAFSTFSIDVDTASYAMARRAIQEGRRPEPESVRTEEFVNSFDYDDAPPASGAFAIHTEGAPSPFRKSFDLLKIGVKAQRIGRDRHRGAVLTFVVDTSGSMNTPDRLGLIRTSLGMVVERLAPEDMVAIVTFNNRASLALEPTPAAQKDAILAVIANLETAGSTQLEGGLKLGYEVAARAFRSGASNRVILMSDGVANLGAADAQAILRAVEENRKQGIYCTVLGFGTGTYDDTMLESLANKGDGTYVYVDSLAEAKRVLVDDLAATLHTVARDVKIQVEFNPERVKSWRQIGYENRRLEKEQFRDDTVDAGEVGSGQAVTALYDIELQGRPEQPVATVRVRYRNLETSAVEEIEQRVSARHFSRDFAAASPRFRLAAGVAEFAELLRMSPYTFSGGRDFADAAGVIRPVALELRLDDRVQELARLVQAAPSLPGL